GLPFMSSEPVHLFDYTRIELAALLESWGFKAVHARWLWRYLYRDAVDDFAAMDRLPKALRARLAESASAALLPISRETHSSDGFTRKYLLGLADNQRIETVLMRYTGRTTACISSQAGCAMGCVF